MVEAVLTPKDRSAAAAPDSKPLIGVIEGDGVVARRGSLLALNLQAAIFHPVVEGGGRANIGQCLGGTVDLVVEAAFREHHEFVQVVGKPGGI